LKELELECVLLEGDESYFEELALSDALHKQMESIMEWTEE